MLAVASGAARLAGDLASVNHLVTLSSLSILDLLLLLRQRRIRSRHTLEDWQE